MRIIKKQGDVQEKNLDNVIKEMINIEYNTTFFDKDGNLLDKPKQHHNKYSVDNIDHIVSPVVGMVITLCPIIAGSLDNKQYVFQQRYYKIKETLISKHQSVKKISLSYANSQQYVIFEESVNYENSTRFRFQKHDINKTQQGFQNHPNFDTTFTWYIYWSATEVNPIIGNESCDPLLSLSTIIYDDNLLNLSHYHKQTDFLKLDDLSDVIKNKHLPADITIPSNNPINIHNLYNLSLLYPNKVFHHHPTSRVDRRGYLSIARYPNSLGNLNINHCFRMYNPVIVSAYNRTLSCSFYIYLFWIKWEEVNPIYIQTPDYSVKDITIKTPEKNDIHNIFVNHFMALIHGNTYTPPMVNKKQTEYTCAMTGAPIYDDCYVLDVYEYPVLTKIDNGLLDKARAYSGVNIYKINEKESLVYCLMRLDKPHQFLISTSAFGTTPRMFLYHCINNIYGIKINACVFLPRVIIYRTKCPTTYEQIVNNSTAHPLIKRTLLEFNNYNKYHKLYGKMCYTSKNNDIILYEDLHSRNLNYFKSHDDNISIIGKAKTN